jgi:7-carboxy-7-deazaguanine synthase
MSDTLVVNEIYLSLQGESTFAGLPCVFVRLTACNLRCSYCDTAYAFAEGRKQPLAEVRAEVLRLAAPFTRGAEEGAQGRVHSPQSPASSFSLHSSSLPGQPPASPFLRRLPLVELTGGEPLLQKNSLPLMRALCDDGLTVLLETSGALDISPVDPRVRRIMDLKCPSSGEAGRNRWENLARPESTDELKFVIGTVEDYQWAKAAVIERHLAGLCPLLFSWVHPLAPDQRHPSLKPVPPGQRPLSRAELAERIIADALPVRLQVQLHKLLWPAQQRGV